MDNNDLNSIDKNVYDTVQEGLKDIDKELDKSMSIEEQAEIVAKDMLLHNYNSKVDIEGVLYIFTLNTGKATRRVNNKVVTFPTYRLTVTDVNKAFNIQQDNIKLLQAMQRLDGINKELNNGAVNLSPKVYKPMVLELEIDDSLEEDQMINLLCKTAIAKLLGEFIVEELPDDDE